MRHRLVAVATALVLTMSVAPAAAQPIEPAQPAPEADGALSAGQVAVQLIVSGLSSPIGVTNAGDGTHRLFVVQQGGTVRVVSNNRLLSGTFLNLSGVAGGFTSGGERGLLGLAFHPNFKSNRKLFINYTNGGGHTVIAELTATADRTSAPLSSLKVLLTITQPYSNHNGGQLAFGPDGNLYIFTGDGGSGGDPQNHAQNTNSRLGKILRITPNLNGGYSVPASNPYVGGGGDSLVWARGLRNPWRASFDTGASPARLWIADVGQGSWEEINRVTASTAGVNYGWRCKEGFSTYNTSGNPCTGLTDPIAVYGHGSGDCSVTGGHVYRGALMKDLVGHYVLGDYCSGRIWTISSGGTSLVLHRQTNARITSFGLAENGEMYMTDHGGRLFRVVAPPFSDITNSGFLDEIMWVHAAGITGGCGGGKYCPEASVTREQMASFLARAMKLPAATRDYFTDDNTSQHEGDINRLAEAGITGGCTATRFCPKDTVTRAQMASFLVRALKLPSTTTNYFDDDNGNIHENQINALAASGITGGCATRRYCPSSDVTRGQMAAFLMRGFRQ
jgi:glucose/arabinose dehydrogenase